MQRALVILTGKFTHHARCLTASYYLRQKYANRDDTVLVSGGSVYTTGNAEIIFWLWSRARFMRQVNFMKEI